MKNILPVFIRGLFFLFLASFSVSSRAGVVLGTEQVATPAVQSLLQGKKWSILSHPASRDARGEHLVDLMVARQAQDGYQIVSLFAPEHGFRGDFDLPVPDTVDPKTGLPVYSLYGPRRAPTAAQLAAVDGVIVDLQDVGVRYYTFSTTMALVMKAAQAAGKIVIVLDRPNPVSGAKVEGAILEPKLQGGFASYYPIPTLHGMTLGELALLYNSEFRIGSQLHVVSLQNWKRDEGWRETGLPWVPPSPALMDVDQAEIYSFLGTLESINLAVGRGQTNERAFKIYGAPWISEAEGHELIADLRALQLPGLDFRFVEWTATRGIFQGQLCRGFEVFNLDFKQVEGLRTLLSVLVVMKKKFGTRLELEKMDRMMGQEWVRLAIEQGSPARAILARLESDLASFLPVRSQYLLY